MALIYRVRSTINYGAGGPGLGTHYFSTTVSSPLAAELTDITGRVRAFYLALVAQLANTVSVLVQGNVDIIADVDGSLNGGSAVAPPAAVVGTGIAPYLPVPTSLVIRLNTNTVLNGRRLEGRSFVGPLSSAAAVSGLTPTVAAGTAAVNAVNALLSGATTCQPLVWRRPRKTPARVGASGPIIAGTAWSQFGVLRSRRD